VSGIENQLLNKDIKELFGDPGKDMNVLLPKIIDEMLLSENAADTFEDE